MKQILAAAFVAFSSSMAVIVGGTFFLFVFASLISQDQRVYNSCLLKHKSADYCRLIVSGR
jgi:hypothetical protein